MVKTGGARYKKGILKSEFLGKFLVVFPKNRGCTCNHGTSSSADPWVSFLANFYPDVALVNSDTSVRVNDSTKNFWANSLCKNRAVVEDCPHKSGVVSSNLIKTLSYQLEILDVTISSKPEAY